MFNACDEMSSVLFGTKRLGVQGAWQFWDLVRLMQMNEVNDVGARIQRQVEAEKYPRTHGLESRVLRIANRNADFGINAPSAAKISRIFVDRR